MEERVGVVGLGYVGLPVALAFARHSRGPSGSTSTTGGSRSCAAGIDRTGELDERCNAQLFPDRHRRSRRPSGLHVLRGGGPDARRRRQPPRPVAGRGASETWGGPSPRARWSSTSPRSIRASPRRSAVPSLERESGLRPGEDFTLGYSPERINPGDQEHTLERITKVVSGAGRSDARSRGRRVRPVVIERASTARRRSRWPRPPRSSRTRSET